MEITPLFVGAEDLGPFLLFSNLEKLIMIFYI